MQSWQLYRVLGLIVGLLLLLLELRLHPTVGILELLLVTFLLELLLHLGSGVLLVHCFRCLSTLHWLVEILLE